MYLETSNRYSGTAWTSCGTKAWMIGCYANRYITSLTNAATASTSPSG